MENKIKEIQATAVSVKTETYEVTITAVYCPPECAIKIERYVKFMERQGHRFIIGGDHNAMRTKNNRN